MLWEAGAWGPGHNDAPEQRAQPVPWKPRWFSGVAALALQAPWPWKARTQPRQEHQSSNAPSAPNQNPISFFFKPKCSTESFFLEAIPAEESQSMPTRRWGAAPASASPGLQVTAGTLQAAASPSPRGPLHPPAAQDKY